MKISCVDKWWVMKTLEAQRKKEEYLYKKNEWVKKWGDGWVESQWVAAYQQTLGAGSSMGNYSWAEKKTAHLREEHL